MKMSKVTQFLKKNVFYISMGIVIIGALVAVLVLPKEGNVPPDSNIRNEQVDGNVSYDYEGERIIVDDSMPSEEDLTSEDQANTSEDESLQSEQIQEQYEAKAEEVTGDTATDEVAATTSEQAESVVSKTDEQDLNTQTFESTTVANLEEPFFAEGDTFASPVEGEIVVPYTDDTTKHWFSQSLNQTMRTYGVCIAANDGEEVKAVAQGKVIDIIPDSSTLDGSEMPYVGKVMIIDIGNGYKVTYGFQNGTPDESLIGKEVNAGDVLGTVGSPTRPFISEGNNIYLQLTHEDQTTHKEQVISPESYLQLAQNE